MPKVIKVQFHANQNAEDVYASSGISKKFYIRQPAQNRNMVIWTTATKADGGYEANTPLKAGVTIRVVKGNRKDKSVIFEEIMTATDESNFLAAEKKELFSYEQLANAAKNLVVQMSLHTYEQWSQWLLSDTAQYNYKGYPDNWLHFGTEEVDSRVIEKLDILGAYYTVEETEWQHKVCGKTWKVLEIKDYKGNVVELCGYQF